MVLPLFVRKFIVDFIETGLGLIFGLALVFPGSFEDLKGTGIVVGGALIGAAVSAARRALPDLYAYVRDVLSVPNE